MPLRATVLLLLATSTHAASPMSTPSTDRLYALAVQSFRQARFPEAYGRFIRLANLGHQHAARQALWMCANGLELFGHEWDCAPQQVEDWTTAAAQRPAPTSSAARPVKLRK